MLDGAYYELAAGEVTIPAGRTSSDLLTLTFKNLDGRATCPNCRSTRRTLFR